MAAGESWAHAVEESPSRTAPTATLQVFSEPVHFDLGGQVIIANERSDRKQAADPTGSSTWGGTLFSFSAMLRYLY